VPANAALVQQDSLEILLKRLQPSRFDPAGAAKQLIAELASTITSYARVLDQIPGFERVAGCRSGICVADYRIVYFDAPFKGLFLNPFHSRTFGALRNSTSAAAAMLTALKHGAVCHCNPGNDRQRDAECKRALDEALSQTGDDERLRAMFEATLRKYWRIYQSGFEATALAPTGTAER
jgi:hypothetical protein